MADQKTQQELLVLWMGNDPDRLRCAAIAEAEVNRSNWLLKLEPGSDDFYRSVFHRAQKRYAGD